MNINRHSVSQQQVAPPEPDHRLPWRVPTAELHGIEVIQNNVGFIRTDGGTTHCAS